jgi:hypothetical protein
MPAARLPWQCHSIERCCAVSVNLPQYRKFTDVTALRLLANRQHHCQRGHRRLAFTHPDTLDTVSMTPAELKAQRTLSRQLGPPPAHGLDASVRIQLTHAVSLRDLGEFWASGTDPSRPAPRVLDAGRADGARDMSAAGWLLSTGPAWPGRWPQHSPRSRTGRHVKTVADDTGLPLLAAQKQHWRRPSRAPRQQHLRSPIWPRSTRWP